MKKWRVVYSQTSREDLLRILRWLAEKASPESALGIVEGIEGFIESLTLAPERGTHRPDLRPLLRMIAYHKAVIAAEVGDDTVYILRIFCGGEDWESAFAEEH